MICSRDYSSASDFFLPSRILLQTAAFLSALCLIASRRYRRSLFICLTHPWPLGNLVLPGEVEYEEGVFCGEAADGMAAGS
jgi:hypothetical protein